MEHRSAAGRSIENKKWQSFQKEGEYTTHAFNVYASMENDERFMSNI
jgi:hypothetical protein